LLLFPALAATCLWRLLAISRRRIEPPDPDAIVLIGAGKLPAGVIALTLSVHWLLFRTIRLLLPNDRTAIYLVTLGFLIAGVLAAIPTPSGQWSRRGTVAVISAMSVYCLRLNYFKEWK